MEDLMRSVSSARKEVQERRLSRVRGSNSISSSELPTNNPPKVSRHKFPLPINHMSNSKTESEGSKTERGATPSLHHSSSVVKLSPEDLSNYRGSPVMMSTSTKARLSENSYEYNRLRNSSVLSPSRSYLRSYKLDAAKLLISKVQGFLSKKFRIWKERTEQLRREEKAIFFRKASYMKVSIGSSQDLKARAIVYNEGKSGSSRDTHEYSNIRRSLIEDRWTNSSKNPESLSASIFTTPKNTQNASLGTEGSLKRFLSEEESQEERTPIIEVMYEDSRLRAKSPDKWSHSHTRSIGSTNVTPLSSLTLGSSKSNKNFDHFHIPSKTQMKEFLEIEKTNAVVKISVTLLFAIKRRKTEILFSIKEWTVLRDSIRENVLKGYTHLKTLVSKRLKSIFTEVKRTKILQPIKRSISPVKNSVQSKSYTDQRPQNQSLTAFYDNIQSQINRLRSSRIQTKKIPDLTEFNYHLSNVASSYYCNTLSCFFVYLRQQIILESPALIILNHSYDTNKEKEIREISSPSIPINDSQIKSKILKAFIKNIEKDTKYRQEACFNQWKLISHQLNKQDEFNSLSALTVTQILDDLILKQKKSFILAIKIARKKFQEGNYEKMKKIKAGFKNLMPHLKGIKIKALNL